MPPLLVIWRRTSLFVEIMCGQSGTCSLLFLATMSSNSLTSFCHTFKPESVISCLKLVHCVTSWLSCEYLQLVKKPWLLPSLVRNCIYFVRIGGSLLQKLVVARS